MSISVKATIRSANLKWLAGNPIPFRYAPDRVGTIELPLVEWDCPVCTRRHVANAEEGPKVNGYSVCPETRELIKWMHG